MRKYAAELATTEKEALNRGMEAKSREFVEKGVEIYATCPPYTAPLSVRESSGVPRDTKFGPQLSQSH